MEKLKFCTSCRVDRPEAGGKMVGENKIKRLWKCKKCLEKWHNFKKKKVYTDTDLNSSFDDVMFAKSYAMGKIDEY